MNMPNLMIDSLKSFVSATGATESLSEIKDGAEVIKDAFMSGARTAQETYRNMRAHGFRKITEWFKDKGDEYADADCNARFERKGDAVKDFFADRND